MLFSLPPCFHTCVHALHSLRRWQLEQQKCVKARGGECGSASTWLWGASTRTQTPQQASQAGSAVPSRWGWRSCSSARIWPLLTPAPLGPGTWGSIVPYCVILCDSLQQVMVLAIFNVLFDKIKCWPPYVDPKNISGIFCQGRKCKCLELLCWED